MNITIKDMIEKCNGNLLIGNPDLICENFCKDTRIIKENDIYVGIKGDNFDGNNFYKDAFDKGAKACIIDNDIVTNDDLILYKDKTIVLVKDSIKALQELAKYKRSLYNIPVIAITGSVGKTSTKDMVSSVLEQKYNVLKTEGNNNNHIGLPLTILKLKDHTAMVLEMGMNNLGEISTLTNIAKPTCAIITNIGTAHIGNLGSRENILKAKLEILEGLETNGNFIINNDNDMLHTINNKYNSKYNLITIGINNSSTYMASNIEKKDNEYKFKIEGNSISLEELTDPFIYNSLVAYSVGKLYNIDESSIIKGIKNFKLSGNRLDIKKNKNGITIINDTYNASFDSMKPALKLLNDTKGNRKIAMLGDILELGKYSKEIHTSIGKEILELNIDYLITIGNDSKYIDEFIINNGFNKEKVYHFNKQEESYKLLSNLLKKDDVILLKGSHGIKLDLVVKELMK